MESIYEESKNLINKDINILKTSSVGSNLFQIFLLYLILVGTAIFLRKIPIFIILAKFLIFIIIQIFSNRVKIKEFYFLFISTIMFIIFFVILQRTTLSDSQINNMLKILLCYVNWYYFSSLISNSIN